MVSVLGSHEEDSMKSMDLALVLLEMDIRV